MENLIQSKHFKTVVLGSGAMGFILSNVLSLKCEKIYLWLPEGKEAKTLNHKRIVSILNSNYKLADNVEVISGYQIFVENSWSIHVVISSQKIEQIIDTVMQTLKKDETHVLAVYSKSFASSLVRKKFNLLTISEYIEKLANIQEFKSFKIAAINGPSLVHELQQSKYTFFNIASKDSQAALFLKEVLDSSYIHCEVTDDVRGAELSGLLKNPISIACGMLSNFPQTGHNLYGEMIMQGFQEMIRFVTALNGNYETLLNRSGLADVITTAMSHDSRNFQYGKTFTEKILSGEHELNFFEKFEVFFNPSDFIEKDLLHYQFIVEGVYALSHILDIAKENNIHMPLYSLLYDILLHKKQPEILFNYLGNFEKFSRDSNALIKKKMGLEQSPGHNFNSLLEKRVLNHILNTRNMITRIVKQISNIQKSLIFRLEKAKHQHIRKELESIPIEIAYWENLKNSDPENQNLHLEKLIKFYVADIADNYHPLMRGALIRLLAPFRFIASGFRKGSAMPIMGGKIEELRSLSKHFTIFYTPTHRTHLDSLEIAFALSWLGLPVPRYASGINLMSDPFWGWLIKSLGAYSVDREKTRNFLYLNCLTLYSTLMLEAGISTLVYPEGTRSRNGGIEEIKFGLLATAIEAYKNTGKEIIIAPISISYESVPEDFHFVDPIKYPLSFKDFISKRTQAYFEVCEPIHISQFINSENPTETIAMKIKLAWQKGMKILPNHVLSKIIFENDYNLTLEDAKTLIEDFINKHPFNYLTIDSNEILEIGLKVLINRKFIEIIENTIICQNKDLIKYYANMVPGLNINF